MQSRSIKIKIGICHGDSLSLLFYIAITALSHELNRYKCGYQVHETESKINKSFATHACSQG